MNPDGSDVIRLTADLLIYPGKGSVSWSPTGSHIVFSAALTNDESTANYDIYIIAVDGSGLTRLTIEPGNDVEPAWSPTP
jgi:Tol biopolymer transport system component